MNILYEKLKSYSQSDYYAFHMPGHKRLMGSIDDPVKIDITEIEDFDDLNHPRRGGVLTQAQERAALLFGAEETHFLINGSTAGILSAVRGCTKPGDRILMARNCHKSVYNAVELGMLRPEYIYPAGMTEYGINGPVSPYDLEKALSSEIKAVVITSPTYDGVCSDIRAMAMLCHRQEIPLIVDQAHGAHFHFSDYFPEDALLQGADVVIHSLHKTLPSLTQTGLLHIQGRLADREKIHRCLTMFQSSSPSYVLMASIDSCVGMLEQQGKELFGEYIKLLDSFRQNCACLKNLELENKELLSMFESAGNADYDNSRLIIKTEGSGFSGLRLMTVLRDRYHLEMEMSAPGYVLGISTVADTKEGFDRLAAALSEIDVEAKPGKCFSRSEKYSIRPESVMSAAQTAAYDKNTEYIYLGESTGRTAASYIYAYPPGIPVLVPGEKIDEAVVSYIKEMIQSGVTVQGLKYESNGLKIRILK